MNDNHEHCQILIAEWFAKFFLSLDLDLYKQYVHLPSSPHNIAFNILNDLRVCKRQINPLGFKFVTKPDKIRQKIEHNISRNIYFREYFQTFMELAVYFCRMEDRFNVPFPIHDDVNELFEEFERMGYVKILGSKVQWTTHANEQKDRFGLPNIQERGNLDGRTLKKQPFQYYKS